jgi:hypothetical protein
MFNNDDIKNIKNCLTAAVYITCSVHAARKDGSVGKVCRDAIGTASVLSSLIYIKKTCEMQDTCYDAGA